MSNEAKRRSFTIGQQTRWGGRLARLVLGVLGLAYIGASVAQARISGVLIGQLASGAVGAATLYVVIYWIAGERILGRLHPWIRTGILWAPLVSIPFLFLIPWGWGFGVLLYACIALIVGAFISYGGCEMVVLPNLLFRRRYTVYCPLNAIDLVERMCSYSS